jgi:hypothetical protein
MTSNTTHSAAAAANAAGRPQDHFAIQVAEYVGFRGTLAADSPALRSGESYHQLLTGRSARRMAARLLAKAMMKAGSCEQPR